MHNPIVYGGEIGIRTLGTRERTTVFKTGAFDRSAISPCDTIYIDFVFQYKTNTTVKKLSLKGRVSVNVFFNTTNYPSNPVALSIDVVSASAGTISITVILKVRFLPASS